METPKAPIVNVWSVRKEQLAARATSSSTAPPSASPPASAPASSTKPTPSNPAGPKSQTKQGKSVKVPPVTDKESWPEVTASLGKDVNGKEKEGERVAKEQPPKKEKTRKWVPIPAEELQATADALKASSSSNRKSGSGKGDGATRRNAQKGPPSQAASTSHSRVQSRSGSVQSSPRNAGRSRRLPAGDHGSGNNSATHSPKVNGARHLDDARTSSLKPQNASSRSSPHPSGDVPPPPGFQPQHLPPAPHHLPLPPHLYPHTQFKPYHPAFPPPPASFSADPSISPSPGDSAYGFPPQQQYLYSTTAPAHVVNGSQVHAGPVQFGSINGLDEVPSVPVVNGDGSRQLLIGVTEDELVRGVKSIAITGTSSAVKIGKRSRRSSFAVPGEEATDGKPKWEFGTTTSSEVQVESEGKNLLDVVVEDSVAARLSPLSMSLSGSPGGIEAPVGLGDAGTSEGPVQAPPGLGLVERPQHPPGLSLPNAKRAAAVTSPSYPANGASPGIPVGVVAPVPVPMPLPEQANEDDFEVRDYGYGFGRASGSGRAVESARDEMLARQQEREWEKERRKLDPLGQSPIPLAQMPSAAVPKEGDRKGNRRPYDGGDRDRGEGRGGGGMRRGGRGHPGGGGGGAGSQHRGNKRSNTPQTSMPNQGPMAGPLPFGPHPHPHAPHPGPLHMPFMPLPFMHGPPTPHGTIPLEGMPSPTAFFGGMRPGFMGPPNLNPGAVSFLPPAAGPPPLPPQLLPIPIPAPSTVISPTTSVGPAPPGPAAPAGAPTVAPPVPAPVTALPFPLDPTRYYLLGQLEYYLSPQNMAKDFFLRQKMDSRGWIPVSVLASFNRVRKLTLDINLVREMLYLSSMVQVRDDWVRMGGWERFVLPGAEESVVPELEEKFETMPQQYMGAPPFHADQGAAPVPPMYLMQNGVPVQGGPPVFPDAQPALNGAASAEDTGDDEDDVVFVMGN